MAGRRPAPGELRRAAGVAQAVAVVAVGGDTTDVEALQAVLLVPGERVGIALDKVAVAVVVGDAAGGEELAGVVVGISGLVFVTG